MSVALKYPAHIGIIMDGNSRWARIRGFNVSAGHRKGANRAREIIRYCSKCGVKYLSLFAFSTENWKRPPMEIRALMNLLVLFLKKELNELNKNNVRLLSAGKRSNFTKGVNRTLDSAISQTETNTGLNLVLCLDYGGRQEIADAADRLKGKSVSADNFRKYLYLPDVPDVDLLIRTSGEERISNFMLWQTAYSELYFTPLLWPDFTEEELEKAVKSYNSRQRRFGMRV